MKLIDQVVEILAENKKAMHVDDIANSLVKKYPNISISLEQLPGKISSLLSTNIKSKKKNSVFSKPKNKQGGFKRGIYRLKNSGKSISKKYKVPEQPKVTTQYTGKAGEFSVLSELLFFGFNASKNRGQNTIVANIRENYVLTPIFRIPIFRILVPNYLQNRGQNTIVANIRENHVLTPIFDAKESTYICTKLPAP